jgi:aryl sulfotransferase
LREPINSSSQQGTWAELHSEDCVWVEHHLGTFVGREAIRKAIVDVMKPVPMMLFPVEWHVAEQRSSALALIYLIGEPMREYRTAVMDSRRWSQFKPRSDDIFICTPAKCGTTWTQTIVGNLLWPSGDLPGPIMVLSPWIEAEFMPAEAMFPMLEAQTHRRFMKSHTAADGIPWFDDAKYIVVGREGKDAFMSLVNHMERLKNTGELNAKAREEGIPELPNFDGDIHSAFDEWLAADDHFLHIIATYWERRTQSNVLLVHFNDLKSDLAGEMHRIAAFLELGVPEAQWDDVVARCTFESMRENADKVGPFDLIFEGGAKGFLFKGTNGRWRDVLTDNELARYEKRASECLPAAALQWLEHGRSAV